MRHVGGSGVVRSPSVPLGATPLLRAGAQRHVLLARRFGVPLEAGAPARVSAAPCTPGWLHTEQSRDRRARGRGMFRKSSTAASKPAPGEQTGSAAAPGATAREQAAGKLAYEARRAAKAGVSLERWMADKQKRAQAEQEAERRARAKAAPAAKPGLLKRLLDRAHKPL